MGKELKDNYKAWEIDFDNFNRLKSFEKKIKHLLSFAVLAPSGHNAQPWKVGINNKKVKIFLEESRQLKIGDTNNRILYIGIGCFIENLLTAADYYGFKPILKIINKKNLIVSIDFSRKQSAKKSKDHLIFAIPKRVTNRNKYGQDIEKKLLRKLDKNLEKNVNFNYLLKEEVNEKLVDDAINSNIETFENDKFREELSEFVRTNITKKYTGMPAFGMGMPTPVSLIVPTLIKKVNVNKLSKKDDLDVLKNYTPAYGLISTRNDKTKDWINTGRVYERISLELTQAGMSTHPMAGPIIIPKYKKNLKKYFGIKNHPQMFFRMGVPMSVTPHSPRLKVDNILK